MNTIDFCFWLQGYFEINGCDEINKTQAKVIQNHLNLVFKHEIDPLRESETPASKEELNSFHSGNDPLLRC